MPWASFSKSEVKIIHIIVQDQDGQNNNNNTDMQFAYMNTDGSDNYKVSK